MYKHILIPTDGSELSKKAIKAGIAVAKAVGAKVTGFYAAPDISYTIGYAEIAPYLSKVNLEEEAKKQAEQYLSVVGKQAQAAGVEADTAWIVHHSPYVAIIETAKKKHCDLILMASHGRSGLSALVLGSETTKVLTHTKIPVLVYR